MTNFQQLISDFDDSLKYDVTVYGYITLFDYNYYDKIINLCEMNNVKIFPQKFTRTNKFSQYNSSRYRIYEGVDILGKLCYYYDYNKGEIFYKIYDYAIQLKQYKKKLRLNHVRELKQYKEKRMQKIIQEKVTSFFKLNKGLE